MSPKIFPFHAAMSPDSSVPMPRTLSNDKITLDAALEEEHNILRRLTYWEKRRDFVIYLLDHSVEIEAIVSYHLNLNGIGSCRLASLDDWIHGSFNICLPIHVKRRKRPDKRVMLRFPLPYKLGEESFRGNVEEKLRSEAATYIWIHDNCPDVPIPQLLGFAFCGNQCVS